MSNLNYKRRNLFTGPRVLGVLFLLAGIIFLIIPIAVEDLEITSRTLWIGIGAIVFGLFVMSTQSGIFISFDKLRLKEYTYILGFKVGEWISISDVCILSISTETSRTNNTPNGISPTLSRYTTNHWVHMYGPNNVLIHSILYDKKEMALKHSKLIATQLGTELNLEKVS